MLFTQLFENDFNDKKRLSETQDDYEDCSYCSGSGEGRYEGQSCSHCGGSGVEPVEQDDDDFDIPDDDYSDSGDEESYYEKSLRSRGLEEGHRDEGESDPLKNREEYAKMHKTPGQVYKKTYPGDKVGMSKSYAYNIKRTGPKGVLPESGVAEGIFGAKENPALPIVNKIASVASRLNAQNVDAGRQIIQSHTQELSRMMNPQAKAGVDVIEQGVAEDVRLPYPVRSEKLGRANMELLIRAYNEPTGPRTTLSFGDRILELDREDVAAIAQYYDNVLRDDNARWNFITGIMSDPDGLTDVLIKLGRRKPQVARQPGLFQEADKKKDDDLGAEVRDVALQRAISRAKADFPTAGSGIEALAKDFMRSQDQDQKSFDQIRQAERKQDQMLAQIDQIDQTQNNEIDDLEDQNSTLTQRLQQLQSVNSRLEKKLAAMSGRKSKPAEPSPDTVAPSYTSTVSTAKAEPQKKKPAKAAKPKTPKAAKPKTPKAAKPTAEPTKIAQAEPKPSDAISSVARQLTTQHPDVLEPAADFVRGAAPRFSTAGAQDVVPRSIASDVRQNVNKMADAMVGNKLQQTVDQELATAEGKQNKTEPPEADYGDEYQAMVQRVGQKAKQGPRKTVWDPVKRVYKTVPVNK